MGCDLMGWDGFWNRVDGMGLDGIGWDGMELNRMDRMGWDAEWIEMGLNGID